VCRVPRAPRPRPVRAMETRLMWEPAMIVMAAIRGVQWCVGRCMYSQRDSGMAAKRRRNCKAVMREARASDVVGTRVV
jgi:hypothetical protein